MSIQGTYQYDDGPLDPFPRQPYAAWFYSPDTGECEGSVNINSMLHVRT